MFSETIGERESRLETLRQNQSQLLFVLHLTCLSVMDILNESAESNKLLALT